MKADELIKEQLKKDVEALTEKYKTKYGLMVIAEHTNREDYFFVGNLCPRCSQAALNGYISKNNLQHFQVH